MLVNKICLGSCAICILYVCLYMCVCICACLCVPVCACVFLLLENRPKPCTKSSQNVPKAATGDRTVLQPLPANDSWQRVILFSNITHPPVLPRLQQVPNGMVHIAHLLEFHSPSTKMEKRPRNFCIEAQNIRPFCTAILIPVNCTADVIWPSYLLPL